jgi:hypothetical protein
MTHWNLRVMQFSEEGGSWFAIHEVYYDGDRPTAYSEAPATIEGETADELREQLERMRAALEKPVLHPGQVGTWTPVKREKSFELRAVVEPVAPQPES